VTDKQTLDRDLPTQTPSAADVLAALAELIERHRIPPTARFTSYMLFSTYRLHFEWEAPAVVAVSR
jgi:hypothetical protein